MAKARQLRHIPVITDTSQILDLFVELLGKGYQVTPNRFTIETDCLLAEVKALGPESDHPRPHHRG